MVGLLDSDSKLTQVPKDQLIVKLYDEWSQKIYLF